MGKKVKIFDRHNIEQRKERRRRIRNSRKILVNFRFDGIWQTALKLPSCEFDKEKYKGVIYFDYGGEFIVFPDWKYTPKDYLYFIKNLQNDQIFYAILYEDLDGIITQTHFRRM